MSLAKEKKRQKVLLIILLLVIVGALIFWFAGKPANDKGTDSESTLSPTSVENQLINMKIDFNVLDGDLFKSLKSHGILPVQADQRGRANPFQSY